MTDAIVCRRYTVAGRVQGVFFRAATAREAERLGVTGWAKNLPDGRVEVLACGPGEAVAALERWLAHGPPMAQVEDLASRSEDPAACADLAGFHTA